MYLTEPLNLNIMPTCKRQFSCLWWSFSLIFHEIFFRWMEIFGNLLNFLLSCIQALFAKLQQLAIVAGDVLLGNEKIQKNLLARVTETVVMWLSDEQEFWGVFEDESAHLQPFGLQQVFTLNFCVNWFFVICLLFLD